MAPGKPHRTIEASFLATAMCGIASVACPEKRSLAFTVRLPAADLHAALCRTLFQEVEAIVASLDFKKRSPTWSGLLSFIDIEGSRYSGAAKNRHHVHCHGLVILPHNIPPDGIRKAIVRLGDLTRRWLAQLSDRKATASGVDIRILSCSSGIQNSLEAWIAYAAKHALSESSCELATILPWDERTTYSAKQQTYFSANIVKRLTPVRPMSPAEESPCLLEVVTASDPEAIPAEPRNVTVPRVLFIALWDLTGIDPESSALIDRAMWGGIHRCFFSGVPPPRRSCGTRSPSMHFRLRVRHVMGRSQPCTTVCSPDLSTVKCALSGITEFSI